MATAENMLAAMEANIKEKTGKPVSHWVKVVQKSGLEKHGQIVSMLKSDHGFTHGYANMVAHEAKKSAASHADGTELVASQYAGAKANLKPIYGALESVIAKLGSDVELVPKKTYVSVRRNKQFAIIQPSTNTRVDLGLNIKGKDPEGALEASGSFNSMVSHRVRLESATDVTTAVKKWIKEAYEAAG